MGDQVLVAEQESERRLVAPQGDLAAHVGDAREVAEHPLRLRQAAHVRREDVRREVAAVHLPCERGAFKGMRPRGHDVPPPPPFVLIGHAASFTPY